MIRFSQKQPAGSRGFTLVEVLVSLMIFAVVVVMAIGAIFSLVNAGEKARSLNSVMENLNIALETMSRTIRTGTISKQDNDGVLANSLTFIPASNNTIDLGAQAVGLTYELLNGQIVQISTDSNGLASAPIPVTAAEVHINSLNFWTYNSAAVPPAQPYVVMSVSGYAETRAENKVSFTIQTTMTGRSTPVQAPIQ